MKLNNRFYLLYGSILIILTVIFFGCDKTMTPYKEFVGENEIVYPAKLDSFELYSGKYRVEFRFPVPPDPRIEKVKIYWHNGQDSVEAMFSEKKDTLVVDINNLKTEGSYTFQIYTFDKAGNRSVKSTKTIRVYGDKYEQFLLNRPINKVVSYVGGSTFLNWGAASRGAFGTMIKYTDTTGEETSLFVPIDSAKTRLTDFRLTGHITYQTLFHPDSTVIDTFYSPRDTARINQIVLRNSQYPIQHAAWDGKRFGNPAYWTVNDAMKTLGGYGGFDGVSGEGYLGNLTTHGRPSIRNGKIYQTVSLPAGTYNLEAKFDHKHGIRKIKDAVYLTVAIGDSLPDIDNIKSQALNYAKVSKGSLHFTLTEEKNITIGFVANMIKGGQTLRCSDVNLFVTE